MVKYARLVRIGNNVAALEMYWVEARRSGLCVAVDEQLSQWKSRLIKTAAGTPVQDGAPSDMKHSSIELPV